ncbi:uncharacterized protein LAESUDRAFT_793351, partial [Laetiporus sulphureus 93-53]
CDRRLTSSSHTLTRCFLVCLHLENVTSLCSQSTRGLCSCRNFMPRIIDMRPRFVTSKLSVDRCPPIKMLVTTR